MTTLVLAGLALSLQAPALRFEADHRALAITAGPAGSHEYALSSNGEVLWKREFPVAVERVAFAPDGSFAGIADTDTDTPHGSLHVLVVDSSGELLRHHRTPHTHGTGAHGEVPHPRGFSVLYHDVLERWLVSVLDCRTLPPPWWFWTFAKADGALLEKVVPALPVHYGHEIGQLDVRAIPGTPLTLVHSIDLDHLRRAAGTRLTVLDGDNRAVWHHYLPENYVREDGTIARLDHSAVVSVDRAAFTILEKRTGDRVTFTGTLETRYFRSSEAVLPAEWTFRETSRTPAEAQGAPASEDAR